MMQRVNYWRRGVLCSAVAASCLLLCAAAHGAPEWRTRPATDLLKGEKPFEDTSFNVGATGFRGWVFHRGTDSSEALQMLVKSVDKGSPADGILEPGDVILGASGDGSQPVKFSTDARITTAKAITSAEVRDPATLKLIRWRPAKKDGEGNAAEETVTLTLETMGAYAPTAPYNCEKSRKILRRCTKVFYDTAEDHGAFSLGILVLLAANDPTDPNNDLYQARAKEWAHKFIGTEDTIDPAQSKVAWQHAYKLIVLAEYYLQTKDKEVLPILTAYANCYANNQSWYGTTGHQYGTKRPDGGNNGPMAGYGAINGTGVAGFLGMLLAREAGISNPELKAAIGRSDIFFSSYAPKSGIAYGEHSYGDGKGMYDMNGKNATVGLAFSLQKHRIAETKFFSKLTTASSADRQASHAGPFFNYVWPALGAANVGEEAAAHYFKRTSWLYDLERTWDGKISHDHFGVGSGGSYRNFPDALTSLLTYALPLRQLYITGRGHDRSNWLASEELNAVVAAEDFDAAAAATEQLASALSSWSPQQRHAAAKEYAERIKKSEKREAYLSGLHKIVQNNRSGGALRNAICQVLQNVGDASSAPVLAGLLEDPESYVRYGAARALRYLPREEVMHQLDKILAATASTIRPSFPMVEGDPLQFAHHQLAMLLFYDGNAYGPKGLLARDISGVDRDLLWPAVRAVATTPTGQGRSTVSSVYKQLTRDEVFDLAGTIVDSVRVVAPADAMFAGGVRKEGIQVLEKYSFAEGIPLCRPISDRMADVAGKTLEKYAGSVLSMDDQTDIMQCLYELCFVRGNDFTNAINAIVHDKEPRTLTPLKRINAVTAKDATLTLPVDKTVLTVDAVNYASRDPKDTVYTWRKVYGAGGVSFSPNASWAAKETTVKFVDEKPGKYRFEVAISDDLGYTIVRDTVDVTLLAKKRLFAEEGKLPPNEPPVAKSMSVTATPGIALPIVLNGSDPDGDDLAFVVREGPAHGDLSGTGSNLQYTAGLGYEGQDSFVFEVIDGQAVAQNARVDIGVTARPVGVTVYEGFDYESGTQLCGQEPKSAVGLVGSWTNNRAKPSYGVFAGSLAYSVLPSRGGKTKLHGGGWRPRALCQLDRKALMRDGVLDAGKEMWFSVVVGVSPKLNRTNGSMKFGLTAQGHQESGTNVGFRFQQGNLYACINGTEGEGRSTSRYGQNITFPADKPHLILGHCVWGEGEDAADTLEIYRVLDIEGHGAVMLKKPISVLSKTVSQELLDTLYFEYWGEFYLDEIRIGPTYESVLLGTVPLSE